MAIQRDLSREDRLLILLRLWPNSSRAFLAVCCQAASSLRSFEQIVFFADMHAENGHLDAVRFFSLPLLSDCSMACVKERKNWLLMAYFAKGNSLPENAKLALNGNFRKIRRALRISSSLQAGMSGPRLIFS